MTIIMTEKKKSSNKKIVCMGMCIKTDVSFFSSLSIELSVF